MLYMTFLWLIYFIPGGFNLLIRSTYFNPLYPPCLWKPPIYCLCLWTLIILGSTYKWDTYLSVWLISLSIITSIHPHCHKLKIFIFYGLLIFHCVCMCIYLHLYLYLKNLHMHLHLCHWQQLQYLHKLHNLYQHLHLHNLHFLNLHIPLYLISSSEHVCYIGISDSFNLKLKFNVNSPLLWP